MNSIVCTLALLLVSSLVFAESKPVAFFPYDQASIFKQEQRSTLSYRLALGPYEKRQNRWKPETSLRLQGQLFRETHELMAGFDEQDVFEFYQSQVPDTATVLYQCERRDCGESNNWANDHFRIKQLYGLNQYQFYTVYQLDDDHYITLYIVRRGNRRVYIQLENFIVKKNNPMRDDDTR